VHNRDYGAFENFIIYYLMYRNTQGASFFILMVGSYHTDSEEWGKGMRKKRHRIIFISCKLL
jgi:hypothetical protein